MLITDYIEKCHHLNCDKCGRRIKQYIHNFTRAVVKKYLKKKTYCGRCVQLRINRNNPDFDYEKEFAFIINKSMKLDKSLSWLFFGVPEGESQMKEL